jgi:hypothetical protein
LISAPLRQRRQYASGEKADGDRCQDEQRRPAPCEIIRIGDDIVPAAHPHGLEEMIDPIGRVVGAARHRRVLRPRQGPGGAAHRSGHGGRLLGGSSPVLIGKRFGCRSRRVAELKSNLYGAIKTALPRFVRA